MIHPKISLKMNDYITINSKIYRIEFNWKTIFRFLENSKLKIHELDDLRNLKPTMITRLLYEGLIEGSLVRSRLAPFHFKEFIRILKPSIVGNLLEIYLRHTSSSRLESKKTNTSTSESPPIDIDTDWLFQIGTGYLKLTPDQFWAMRPKDFFLTLLECNRIEENRHRIQCNLTRMQTTEIINIQLKKEDRITPNQLWKFPWDNEYPLEEVDSNLADEVIKKRSEELFDMLPD